MRRQVRVSIRNKEIEKEYNFVQNIIVERKEIEKK